MKQVFVTTAFAIALATMVFGCASETTGPSSETGSVGLNIIIDGEDVTSVAFTITGDAGTLSGNLNVNDEDDPPIAATVMDLPPGPYNVRLTAFDSQGEPLCTGTTDFVVVANQTVDANVVLQCGATGEELLGNVNITGVFEFIPTNICPRLHFLNAVPDEVPAEGSEVTVLVSDADGDTLTTALTATGGSFADPSARPTTYFCDGAAGTQTISVTVSDGDPGCEPLKSKSFDVTCPGVDPCEGVECPDTGNQCTVGICTNQSAPDCEETDVANDTTCDAGGIEDVADNGGVEEGTLNGWEATFCTPPDFSGPCTADDTMPNTGDWAVRIFNDVRATPSVLKQANKAVGLVQPNSQVTVRFAAKGNFAEGGVAFAEFFSELAGGGTSKAEILGNAPLPLQSGGNYQPFEFVVTTGDDVSGGITLQFNAATADIAGSTAELFVDDVVILVEGGGPGTCQDGDCVPDDLCDGVICDDQNECTIDTCAGGNCSFTPDTGASCDNGAGTCDAAGVCQANDLCEGNTCDDDDTECSDSSCDVGTGQCVSTPINEGNDCDGGAGTCSAGDCVPNATANAFIKTLDPNNGFQTSLIDTVDTTNLPDTWGGYTASITIPDDDAFINQVLQFGFQNNASNFQSSGVFYDNVVLNPGPEYTQDFDSFDITVTPIGDGWLFFNNVFDSAGNRKFGYNGLAPNATADTDPSDGETFISAIVDDQGGAGQGTQQLSVFSDYNCCGAGTTNEGHFGTDLVEVNVFQERRLTADDLGVTLEFIFEAKAGNIGQ